MDLNFAALCIDRDDIYAANRTRRQEARNQYQKAVEILSELKAENKIGLEDLNNLRQIQEKLQALEN